MSRALSLPHEHGGYLTIAGATASGVALAHAHAPALAVGAAIAAAFFARAPVEELARGRGARLDALALALFAVVVVAALLVLGGAWRAVALAAAAAIVGGSALARRARHHRATWFETVGMAALGASAGLVACAGGVEVRVAAAVAVVVAAHTGLAVPLVRSEVRPRERERARRAAWSATAALAVAAAALTLLGEPRFALALVPRGLHAVARLAAAPSPSHPNVVGVRESVMLALVVVLIVLVAR